MLCTLYIVMYFEQLCSNSRYICNLCFRLLAQLDETENAFEQFWSKHHLKLEQCLQLRHFEQDFREVKYAIAMQSLVFHVRYCK